MTDMTPHGYVIETARGTMSKREAAKRAGVSEGRWRQIVTGVQKIGRGEEIRVNPRRDTLIKMARAVDADVNQVLVAAGMAPVGADVQDDSGEPDSLLYQRPRGLTDPEWDRIRRESLDYIEFQIERATGER